jgi:1-phosphatidylinositol-3-phosphate 5-kinase
VFLGGADADRGAGAGDEHRHLDDDSGFVKSLATSFHWKTNGGKSGAYFSKTADQRFVVKCISRTELQMFLDCAPAYFEYLSKAFFHGLPTCLCKIVGVYQIGYHNRVTGKRSMEQVAIMQVRCERASRRGGGSMMTYKTHV